MFAVYQMLWAFGHTLYLILIQTFLIMADVSTLSGAITYFLYAIPVFAAIWIGLIQLRVQVKVSKNIHKAQQIERYINRLFVRIDDVRIMAFEILDKDGGVKSQSQELMSLADEGWDLADEIMHAEIFLFGNDQGGGGVWVDTADVCDDISLARVKEATTEKELSDLVVKLVSTLDSVKTDISWEWGEGFS